jgi:hypothetical protein
LVGNLANDLLVINSLVRMIIKLKIPFAVKR